MDAGPFHGHRRQPGMKRKHRHLYRKTQQQQKEHQALHFNRQCLLKQQGVIKDQSFRHTGATGRGLVKCQYQKTEQQGHATSHHKQRVFHRSVTAVRSYTP